MALLAHNLTGSVQHVLVPVIQKVKFFAVLKLQIIYTFKKQNKKKTLAIGCISKSSELTH